MGERLNSTAAHTISKASEARKPVPKSGVGFLQCLIDGVMAHVPAALIDDLEAPHRHGGNPGYEALPMLCAYTMQFVMSERYANAYLTRLNSDDRLLEICGLEQAPSEAAYCRFKKKLVQHEDTIRMITAALFYECGEEIERLREEGLVPADRPPLGHSLVIDSTDVEAWARPGRRSRKTQAMIPSKDSDSRWGHRTAKTKRALQTKGSKRRSIRKSDTDGSGNNGNKDDKDEVYFGYKSDVVVDANWGLPMLSVTRPANVNDVSVLIEDIDALLALYDKLSPHYLVADKGYDSLKNLEYLVSRGIVPVVAIRLPEKDKETGLRLYDGMYDTDGRLLCIGGRPMDYVGTDPVLGHRSQCPPDGCHLKDKIGFTRYCDSDIYEKPDGPLLRIVGLLPRFSEEWRAEYKKRPIVERGFSSAKHSRLLNQHRYLNLEKVSLHVAMSLISYLATSLARLKANDLARLRHMRVELPKAKKRTAKRPLEPRIDSGVVAALMMHELNAMPQAA